MSTHFTLSRDCNARVSVREWGALWWRHCAKPDLDARLERLDTNGSKPMTLSALFEGLWTAGFLGLERLWLVAAH
jgi:hypothetical protein